MGHGLTKTMRAEAELLRLLATGVSIRKTDLQTEVERLAVCALWNMGLLMRIGAWYRLAKAVR